MFGVSLSNAEKLSVLGNLATMLGSGIPIIESVNSLLEDTIGNQRKVLSKLRDDLMQGKRVADSFATFPKVFDKVTTNLLRAAEEAGHGREEPEEGRRLHQGAPGSVRARQERQVVWSFGVVRGILPDRGRSPDRDVAPRRRRADSAGAQISLTLWVSVGSGGGQLSYPRAIGTDPDGNVCIVDSFNHRGPSDVMLDLPLRASVHILCHRPPRSLGLLHPPAPSSA